MIGARASRRRTAPLQRGRRGGFTLIEVLIAASLLGFSLIVMFGFHSQAVRSNMQARKMTDCTYLAQLQMERLMSLPWSTTLGIHTDLVDSLSDPTSSSDTFAYLEHPNSGSAPTALNAAYSTDTTYGTPIYYVTWDSSMMDSDSTWARMRVRCQFYDFTFNVWRGTTISSYRYRDA